MNNTDEKINQLKEKIEDIEKKKSNQSSSKKESGAGFAFKISTELIAAVVVGTTIGFLLDNWFDTKPLLIICFFFMGVAAGIINVFRSAKRMNKKL